MRLVEIAIGVPNQPGARDPAAAAQHFVVAEPRRGVFLIGPGSEPGVRPEVRRRPLPYVPDHLTAPERAVTRRQGVDFERSHGAPIEIRALRCGKFIAPRILAPPLCG